jgi:3-phenylpropionate/trans-cinnamate dioxygenase ferredoxin subunit
LSEWVDVGRAKEISIGKPVHIEIDEDVCTHDGGKLTGGCIENDVIVCPRHGARFSIRTGEALSAPAYEPTATFPVRIENGMVQVRDDRWD